MNTLLFSKLCEEFDSNERRKGKLERLARLGEGDFEFVNED